MFYLAVGHQTNCNVYARRKYNKTATEIRAIMQLTHFQYEIEWVFLIFFSLLSSSWFTWWTVSLLKNSPFLFYQNGVRWTFFFVKSKEELYWLHTLNTSASLCQWQIITSNNNNQTIIIWIHDYMNDYDYETSVRRKKMINLHQNIQQIRHNFNRREDHTLICRFVLLNWSFFCLFVGLFVENKKFLTKKFQVFSFLLLKLFDYYGII